MAVGESQMLQHALFLFAAILVTNRSLGDKGDGYSIYYALPKDELLMLTIVYNV